MKAYRPFAFVMLAIGIAAALPSCQKDDIPVIEFGPTLAQGVTAQEVVLSSSVLADGGSAVSERGFCFDLKGNPSLLSSHVVEGKGSGSFSATVGQLWPNTTYYARPYATNGAGTSYGPQAMFKTLQGAPRVRTTELFIASPAMIVSEGKILTNGGSDVTAKGICWSTTPNPTLDQCLGFTQLNSGGDIITDTIHGMTNGVKYYVRAYATNALGTGYGASMVVTDYNGLAGSVTDVEGNTYPTIGIGGQVWMAKNLTASKYRDGSSIYKPSAEWEWSNLTLGAWANYDNDPQHDATFGKLYNGFAIADPRGLCPAGWSVPTAHDFSVLVEYNGGWNNSQTTSRLRDDSDPFDLGWAGTNESQFSALPGGMRYDGGFFNLGYSGHWWSATSSGSHFNHEINAEIKHYYSLYMETYNVGTNNYNSNNALSVRCIKDLAEE